MVVPSNADALASAMVGLVMKPDSRKLRLSIVALTEQVDAKKANLLKLYLAHRRIGEPLGCNFDTKSRGKFIAIHMALAASTRKATIAVAGECASKALQHIDNYEYTTTNLRELVRMIGLNPQPPKWSKLCKNAFDKARLEAGKIEDQWHFAYGEGTFNSISERDFQLSNIVIFATEVILLAAWAAVSPPRKYMEYVERMIFTFIEIDTILENRTDVGPTADAILEAIRKVPYP